MSETIPTEEAPQSADVTPPANLESESVGAADPEQTSASPAGEQVVEAEAEDEDSTYLVSLEMFEGPLDLLLHLVRRHELDILDIPISFVTEKYLEYLEFMRAMDLEIAGDYLVMAATLAFLKSRELLPPDPTEEEEEEGEEEEGEDPREALIRRLLEYERFKAAAHELNAMPISGRDVFSRGVEIEPPNIDPGLAPVTLFKLAEAYNRVLTRAKIKQSHEVQLEPITVAQRMEQLTLMLRDKPVFEFEELFLKRSWSSEHELRSMLVVTLMSLLEMVKMGIAQIEQPAEGANIRVARRAATDQALRMLGGYDEESSFGDAPPKSAPTLEEALGTDAPAEAGEPASSAAGTEDAVETPERGDPEADEVGEVEAAPDTEAAADEVGEVEAAPDTEAAAEVEAAPDTEVEAVPVDAEAVEEVGDVAAAPGEPEDIEAATETPVEVEAALEELGAATAEQGGLEAASEELGAATAERGDLEATPDDVGAALEDRGEVEVAPEAVEEVDAAAEELGDVETVSDEPYVAVPAERGDVDAAVPEPAAPEVAPGEQSWTALGAAPTEAEATEPVPSSVDSPQDPDPDEEGPADGALGEAREGAEGAEGAVAAEVNEDPAEADAAPANVVDVPSFEGSD